MPQPRDPGLDGLLDLDGVVLVISEDGKYWVKFDITQVEVSSTRPHGLRYSLTLHGPHNERIVGFDNSHPAPKAPWTGPHDHRHVLKMVKPYEYADAAGLLEAFWTEVDKMLRTLGMNDE